MHIDMKYMGSVDIMNELTKDQVPYDAVWVANPMWIQMGDSRHLVKDTQSIMTSPIVFGVKESIANKLGWVGRDVKVADIVSAIESKKLSFAMTSATQSNSGASAYFGFWSAMLGSPETISLQDLQREDVKQKMTSFLSGINRSSGSSDWLKELFLQGNYEAMFNYEAVILETNKELIVQGKEPLHLIYPVDGLSVADYPLGFLLHPGEEQKASEIRETFFKGLQQYLLSKDVQQDISKLGRRTSDMSQADPAVFNSQWGVDLKKFLTPIKYPSADVVRAALNLYQSELRKPSLTYYLLDFSGSMEGDGERQLKQAMEVLLNQEKAKTYLLQASARDRTIVIPFSNDIKETWRAEGAAEMQEVLRKIEGLAVGGGTNIYKPAQAALEDLHQQQWNDYIPSIVLMTDGQSNEGSFEQLKKTFESLGIDIPIFSITFGDADVSQLNEISKLTHSRVFDGGADLIQAFKQAKGYT